MSGKTFSLLCLFMINFSFIVCVDINGQNETVSYPCGLNDSEIITDGELLQNDSIVYNNILYNRDQYFFLSVNGTEQKRGCPCLVRPCSHLCCPLGKMGYPKCVEANYTFEIPIYEENTLVDGYIIYHKYFNNSCLKYRETEFHLQKNGSLLITESNISTIYPRDEYCIDFVELPEEVEGMKYQVDALMCFHGELRDEAREYKIKILSKVMLISVPFLVATLVVYCILPELHNLHGYIMITYLSCITTFFIFLAALQISSGEYEISHVACVFLGFAVYFFGMVSFFWMNVMCFDIWWTFSGQRTWRETKRTGIKKRYMLYSIYAWVLPTLLTCLLAYMQFNEDLSVDYITPGFGYNKCWFQDTTSQFMYLYLPISILLACNVVLFSTTTYRIFSISRETQMLQENQGKKRTFKKERQRFFIYLKLFALMGLNWIMEILSLFVNNKSQFWILTDVLNCLIGVLIFIILVLKKKILKLLMKRYMPCFGDTVMKQKETSSTLASSRDNSVGTIPTNLQRSSSNSTTNTEINSEVL